MAIDTNNEKFALITYHQPWNTPLPISTDGLGQADNQHLLWEYPGVLWSEAEASISEPIHRVREFVFGIPANVFSWISEVAKAVNELLTLGITALLDEDDMSSNSATGVASQQSIKKYVADTSATLTNNCKIQTLTYEGDGSTSYHIDTDIHPLYVRILNRETVDTTNIYISETTNTIVDDHASGAAIRIQAAAVEMRINMIPSLDADGFTVDDAGADAHPNKNGQVYNVLVLGY